MARPKSGYLKRAWNRIRPQMSERVCNMLREPCQLAVEQAEVVRGFKQFTGNAIFAFRAYMWSASGKQMLDYNPAKAVSPISPRIQLNEWRRLKNPVEGNERPVLGKVRLIDNSKRPLVTKIRSKAKGGMTNEFLQITFAVGAEYLNAQYFLEGMRNTFTRLANNLNKTRAKNADWGALSQAFKNDADVLPDIDF